MKMSVFWSLLITRPINPGARSTPSSSSSGDASRQSFLAGVDIDMESEGYRKYLAELVRTGVVPAARVDAAAGAVLAAKIQLGLLDDPFRYCDAAREKSTLLRALSGTQEASGGAVVFDGRDITHMPPHEIAARGVDQ